VLTWMENRAFGLSMTDYHSGFLLYSRRAVETIPFDRLSHYFDFDLEVIACASPSSPSPPATPANNRTSTRSGMGCAACA